MRADLRRWGRAHCPVCGLHLAHAWRPRRGPPPRYCSRKCRQKAYRRRHQPSPRQHERAKWKHYLLGWLKRYDKYGRSGGRNMGRPPPKRGSKWAPEFPWYVVLTAEGGALLLEAGSQEWLANKLAPYPPDAQEAIKDWLRHAPEKMPWQAIEGMRGR